MRVALANPDCDCNGDAYCNPGAAKVNTDAETASDTGASAVRPGFNGSFSYGDSRCSRVPVMRTSPPRRILGVLRAYSVSLKLRRSLRVQ